MPRIPRLLSSRQSSASRGVAEDSFCVHLSGLPLAIGSWLLAVRAARRDGFGDDAGHGWWRRAGAFAAGRAGRGAVAGHRPRLRAADGARVAPVSDLVAAGQATRA